MSLMSAIWNFLGLDTPAPPVPFSRTGKPKARKAPEEKPDNLVHYAGRPFLQVEDTINMIVEDTIYRGGAGRDAVIRAIDKRVIFDMGLDETKYRELKPMWAAGMSSSKASQQFHGKRGYKPRTLDNYWRAFSVASATSIPTPLPA